MANLIDKRCLCSACSSDQPFPLSSQKHNNNETRATYNPPLGLAGVAQWTEGQPTDQEGACSIPCQGTCLSCRPGPQLGGVREATTH